MLALKTLVGVMGVLLIFALGLVVGGVLMQNKQRADPGRDASVAELELPPGSKIVESTALGERLVLRVALAEGGERLLVVDLASGKTVSTIEIKQQK